MNCEYDISQKHLPHDWMIEDLTSSLSMLAYWKELLDISQYEKNM